MKQGNTEIDQYRKHEMYGRPMRSTGNNGVFKVPYKQHYLNCVVSDGERDGFEHVSVSCQFKLRGRWQTRIPNWEEMCFIKDLFWGEDEVVMQLHPAKENYINNRPHVLHLWRPLHEAIPLPPVTAVGIPGVKLDPSNPAHTAAAAKVWRAMNGGNR